MSRIQELIEQDTLRIVFQPILDLATNKTFAFEALVRCSADDIASPPALFELAMKEGMVGHLGRYLRELSVVGCPDAPLFLNLHPNELDEGWLVRPDDALFTHELDVYVEITESVPMSHPELCHRVLDELKSKGIKVAIDDLGAGYSNLKYIADLSPEIVKIDRELVREIKMGSRHHTLLDYIVQLCKSLGSHVVAEGIETDDEMNAVRSCGVQFGQGYLIARPSFPPPSPSLVGLEPPSTGEFIA